MDTIAVKPKQSVNLMLENVSSLRNPKLSIMLADGNNNNNNGSRENRSQTLLYNVDTTNNCKPNGSFGISLECSSCDSLKNMLYLRDRTIMKLAEDRDSIKIKLTKAMNMNIELSRQLMRYQNVHSSNNRASPSKQPTTANFYNEKIREEVNDLRTKCKELEEINNHLKHHLNTLRNVFVELGNEDETSSAAAPDTTTTTSGNSESKSNETIYANVEHSTKSDKNNNSHSEDLIEEVFLKKPTQLKSETMVGAEQPKQQQQLSNSTKNNKKVFTEELQKEEKDNNNVEDEEEEDIPIQNQIHSKPKKKLSNFEIWYNS